MRSPLSNSKSNMLRLLFDVRKEKLNRYGHCEAGGWCSSGIDVLTGEEALWGQFKPDRPRTYQEKKGFGQTKTKAIKYELPLKTPTEIYALRVPLHIWELIAHQNNVPMPDKIVIEERTGEAIGTQSFKDLAMLSVQIMTGFSFELGSSNLSRIILNNHSGI